MENVLLDSRVTGEEPRTYFYDGTTYTVAGPDVAFLDIIRKCPTALKCLLVGISWQEAERYAEAQKMQRRIDIATLFTKKWIFKDTGDRINFNNLTLNYDLFELKGTKAKIIRDIVGGKVSEEQVDKIEAFFQNDEEIKEIYS